MKKIIVIVILMLFSVWMVSADLSDWLFCSVRKNEVTISLKQTPWYYNCKDTIVSLEHLIVDTAKDLMKIQTYINRGHDIDYRKTIRTEKRDLLATLQLSKTTILTNMATFQNNLLQKSLVKIQALTLSGYATSELNSYALLLKAQVAVIDSLSKATTQAELNDLLAKYVYLKKEIAWKSE